MTTPPSPSSASRPLPAALSEKIDALETACLHMGARAGSIAFRDDVAAARASLDAALRGMLDDAERLREELAHAFLAGVEHVGGARGVSPEDALVAIEYAARAARPEASADEAQ